LQSLQRPYDLERLVSSFLNYYLSDRLSVAHSLQLVWAKLERSSLTSWLPRRTQSVAGRNKINLVMHHVDLLAPLYTKGGPASRGMQAQYHLTTQALCANLYVAQKGITSQHTQKCR